MFRPYAPGTGQGDGPVDTPGHLLDGADHPGVRFADGIGAQRDDAGRQDVPPLGAGQGLRWSILPASRLRACYGPEASARYSR
jgi:hypothetical protein